MVEYLNEFLADKATMLVEENFTGVSSEWWWERRMGGGIAICQTLDPTTMIHETTSRTNEDPVQVQESVQERLGVDDLEPVVLTFEISGEASAPEAARMLQERSSTREGLAAGIYRQIEDAVRSGA